VHTRVQDQRENTQEQKAGTAWATEQQAGAHAEIQDQHANTQEQQAGTAWTTEQQAGAHAGSRSTRKYTGTTSRNSIDNRTTSRRTCGLKINGQIHRNSKQEQHRQ
jgi:hypothetical protein